MEKKKAEYVPAIGRESTNLFMMFSPKDSTCFLTDELVLKINKMKEKTFIQKSTTALNTHTQKLEQTFCPFSKYICKEVPLPLITARIFLITKS